MQPAKSAAATRPLPAAEERARELHPEESRIAMRISRRTAPRGAALPNLPGDCDGMRSIGHPGRRGNAFPHDSFVMPAVRLAFHEAAAPVCSNRCIAVCRGRRRTAYETLPGPARAASERDVEARGGDVD